VLIRHQNSLLIPSPPPTLQWNKVLKATYHYHLKHPQVRQRPQRGLEHPVETVDRKEKTKTVAESTDVRVAHGLTATPATFAALVLP